MARALVLGGLALLPGCRKAAAPASSAAAPRTEAEKADYALGALLGKSVAALALGPAEVEQVVAGLRDRALGKELQVDLGVYGPKAQQLNMEHQAAAQLAAATAQKAKDAPFMEAAAKEPGAIQLPSGLVFKELTAGQGASPVNGDTVEVNFEGSLVDGTVFDGTRQHGGPRRFALNATIPCLAEGVKKLSPGGSARLVCPSGTGYGDRGRLPVIPGGATLRYEVELLAVNPAPLAVPPPRFKRHGSGGPPAGQK